MQNIDSAILSMNKITLSILTKPIILFVLQYFTDNLERLLECLLNIFYLDHLLRNISYFKLNSNNRYNLVKLQFHHCSP